MARRGSVRRGWGGSRQEGHCEKRERERGGVSRSETQPAITTQNCDETDRDDTDDSTRSESECGGGNEDDNQGDEDDDPDEAGSGVGGRSVGGGGCDSADGREASDDSRRRRRGRWLAERVEVWGEMEVGKRPFPRRCRRHCFQGGAKLLIEVGAKGWPSAGSSRGRQSGCEGVLVGRVHQVVLGKPKQEGVMYVT